MFGMSDFDEGIPLGSTSVGRKQDWAEGEDKQQVGPLQTQPTPTGGSGTRLVQSKLSHIGPQMAGTLYPLPHSVTR